MVCNTDLLDEFCEDEFYVPTLLVRIIYNFFFSLFGSLLHNDGSL